MRSRDLFLALAIGICGSAQAAPPVEVFKTVVLTFKRGSDELPDSEKMKLKQAINEAKGKGEIAKAEVAVWSDKDHPATGNLPRADEKLASDRIEKVKDVLNDDLGALQSVDAYNMANNASWLGRNFHTDEAKLDAVMAKQEPGNLARKDFLIFKREGAPSKAVVLLRVKQ